MFEKNDDPLTIIIAEQVQVFTIIEPYEILF